MRCWGGKLLHQLLFIHIKKYCVNLYLFEHSKKHKWKLSYNEGNSSRFKKKKNFKFRHLAFLFFPSVKKYQWKTYIHILIFTCKYVMTTNNKSHYWLFVFIYIYNLFIFLIKVFFVNVSRYNIRKVLYCMNEYVYTAISIHYIHIQWP